MVRLVVALAMCLATCAFAFTSPSFVVSRKEAFETQIPVATARSVQARSSTILHMNLFSRFTRVAKSNLNNILKRLEDPEKIMSQALEDMQNDLVSVRQSYAEVTATQRRLLKQKEQAETMANDWYQRAQLALRKGHEDLAREALGRRQTQTDEAANLQVQIDVQAESIDKLYEGMQLLERKILESKSKKDQLAARAHTAQSTQKVNDMLGGITGKTSMDAFSRMEEKVEALEAAAEVSAEMGTTGGNLLAGSSASSLESQFLELESSKSVDDELNKLKGLLGDGTTQKADATVPEVDEEVQRLMDEAGL